MAGLALAAMLLAACNSSGGGGDTPTVVETEGPEGEATPAHLLRRQHHGAGLGAEVYPLRAARAASDRLLTPASPATAGEVAKRVYNLSVTERH